jgi:hypothetical protein
MPFASVLLTWREPSRLVSKHELAHRNVIDFEGERTEARTLPLRATRRRCWIRGEKA